VKDAEELVMLLTRVMRSTGPKNVPIIADGYISLSEFQDLMSRPEIVSFFEVRCLKATTAYRFFKQMLEMDKTDKIDIGTFVSACVKLDGTASSIDLHVVSVEVRTLLLKQTLLQDSLNARLHRITDAVESRLNQFPAVSGESMPLSRANDNAQVTEEDEAEEDEDLPPGWESAWRNTDGLRYYFNRQTGERTWIKPIAKVANGRGLNASFQSPRSKMGPSSQPSSTDSPHAWKPTRPMGDHSDEGPLQEESRGGTPTKGYL